MKGKKKLRKIRPLLCLLLAVVLICGTVPIEMAFASGDETAQGTEELTEADGADADAQAGEEKPKAMAETEEASVSEFGGEDPESEETEVIEGAGTERTTSTGSDTYTNSISGVIWIDTDEDGTYDSTELPLADYPVYLYAEGDTDNAMKTVTTDMDGIYLFKDMEPGSRYIVGIKAEENGRSYLLPLMGVQNDNKFYFTPDYSKVISNPIDISEDTTVTDVNAGMRLPPGIEPMAISYSVTGTLHLQIRDSSNVIIPNTQFEIISNYVTGAGTTITTDANGYALVQLSASGSHNNVTGDLAVGIGFFYYLKLPTITGISQITVNTGAATSTTGSGKVTVYTGTSSADYTAGGYNYFRMAYPNVEWGSTAINSGTYTGTSTIGTASSPQVVRLGAATTRTLAEYHHNIDASDTTYGIANNLKTSTSSTVINGTTISSSPANITTGSGTSATTYTYVGYNTTNNRTTIGTSVNQSITANTSLYYYYRRNVTVNFNANGGSGAPSAVTRASDVALGTVTSPTRAGYTFAGWNTAAGGTGTTVTSSTYARAIPTTTNRNTTTLYAQWTANTYTVNFNANGGTTSTASKSVTYASTYGTLPIPTRTGYTFSGWYTAASGGTQVSSSTTVAITATQTLYAQWTVNTYTIEYNANGGTGAAMAPTTITYDISAQLSPNTYTRTGHVFIGWYAHRLSDDKWYYRNNDGSQGGWYVEGTEPAGLSKFIYTDARTIGNSSSVDGDTVTLYAQWETDVTVEYVDTSGTSMPGTAPTTHTVTSGEPFIATIRSFPGYALKDWKLDGVPQGNTTPAVSSVTAPCTIALVYDTVHTVVITYADKNGTPLTTQPTVTGIDIINGGTFTLTTDTVSQYTPVYYTVDGGAVQYALTDTQTVTGAMSVTVYFASTIIDVTIPAGNLDFHVDQTTYPDVEAGTFGQDNIYYTFTNNSDYPIDVEFNTMQVVTADGVGFAASHTGGGSPEVVLNLDIAAPSMTGSTGNAFITGVSSLNPSGSYATSIGVMEGQFISSSAAAQGDTGYLTLSGTYAGPLSATVKQPALKLVFTYSLVTAS